jgi:hypothetical protein
MRLPLMYLAEVHDPVSVDFTCPHCGLMLVDPQLGKQGAPPIVCSCGWGYRMYLLLFESKPDAVDK